MEVTSSNSNQFTPKLGQVSKGSLPAESFSSHLLENDPAPRQEPQARPDRDPGRENDDRQTAAAEARSSDRKRAEEARDREAAEEARATDKTDNAAEETDKVDLDDNPSFDESVQGEFAGTSDENTPDLTADEQNTGSAIETDGAAVTSSNTDSEDQNASAVSATQAGTDDDALVKLEDIPDEVNLTSSATKNDTAISAEQAAANAAKATSAQNATTEAAQSTTPQVVRPVDVRAANNNTNPQETASIGETIEDGDGLPGALASDFETGADADGEAGLGAKTAEAMANKNKAGAAGDNASNVAKPTTTNTAAAGAAPTLPAIPLQSLASLGLSTSGLNAGGLPAGLDFEQLGLSTAGQTSSTPQNNNPVLVRFGVLPGQAQATQVPNTAIALQIAKHVAKGVSTFEIRLDPAELGRVDVKLELAQDGRVTAHLAIERPETLDLLQRDAKALEQALRDAGLDTDDASLEFSLNDGSSNQANADGSRPGDASEGRSDNKDASADQTSETTRVTALAARQLQAAARGGIDVSI